MIRTFADVIDHLRSHPRVSMVSPDSRVTFAEGAHRFLGVEQGLMWFEGPDRVKHHLPIDCGLTDAESGIQVKRDGFVLTKFGVEIHVTFLDGGA
jgi:hypothetical protein